jgi:ABC-type nitrate/sulfonate/bicarbonate transport system substrate-binding protein
VKKIFPFWPVVLFAAIGFAHGLPAADSMSLRGVYNAPGGTMTPIWVAHDLGLFNKHEIALSLQYIPATTAVQAMVAGSVDIGLVGNQGIDLNLEGADTVYVASTAQTFVFGLYGQPGISSVTDLKGKVVAVTQPAASTDYAARIALTRFGLTPGKDVQLLYAGSVPAVVTSILSGHAAAAVGTIAAMYPPMMAGKIKLLADITKMKIPFVFVGALAPRKFVKEQREAVKRFLLGYIEAISVIKKDKDASLRVMQKYLKFLDSPLVPSSSRDQHEREISTNAVFSSVRPELGRRKRPATQDRLSRRANGTFSVRTS